MSLLFALIRNQYNFQQRISWLSHRWRTQRNAIRNVNCRIQWIIESLNAPCAPWYSEGHTRLSVVNILNLSLVYWPREGLDFGGFYFCWLPQKPAPPKWISRVCFADPWRDKVFLRLGLCTSQFWILLLTVFARDNVVNLDLKSGETTRWT